jgi:hypothetical protein
MSRALCPCEVMTSHIAVLLGDLFHFSSRIAPKSHSVAPADAQYAPRLAANPRLPERVVRLLLQSTPRGAVLAICAAAVFVVETVLVILRKQVEPGSPAGAVYAVLMAVALLGLADS